MVEKIGNLITSYSKKKKKPAAPLDRLSCRPPLNDKKRIGNNEPARSLNNFQVNPNKLVLVSANLPHPPQFTSDAQFIRLRLVEGSSNSIFPGILKSFHLCFAAGNDSLGKVSEHLKVGAFKPVTQ